MIGSTKKDGEPGRPHFQLYTPALSNEVWWRLLSANNRDLGRSVSSHPDTDACIASLNALLLGLDTLEPLVRRRHSTEWRWQLCADGDPVIDGAHGYDRQIRCEQAARQFVRHAATAVVSPTLVMTGRRRWTGASGALHRVSLNGPPRVNGSTTENR
jgi:hypothetical protein